MACWSGLPSMPSLRWPVLVSAVCSIALLFAIVAYSAAQSPLASGSGLQKKLRGQRRLWSPGAASQPTTEQLEEAYQTWLASFQTADPEFQDYCLQVLVNSTHWEEKGAQHHQDVFLFHNLYKYFPMQGRKGFYIESGANDALYLSTSLFFDKCLGWSGLCVEPQEKFHQALRANRSCTLVPECISAKKQVLKIAGTDATAKVTAAGAAVGTQVNCSPLEDILERYAGSDKQQVDLWILDVEGFEMTILRQLNFSAVNIDAVIIEDLLITPKPDLLDIVMSKNGFLKYQELSIDSVFVRRGHPAALSTRPLWLPPGFDADVAEKTKFVHQYVSGFLKQAWANS